MENTSKRLEINDIITELLKSISLDEVKPTVYMTTTTLGPDYNELILGIKTQSMKKIISEITGLSSDKITQFYREYGDLGDVIYNKFDSGSRQSSLDNWFGSREERQYTILEIWDILKKISSLKGEKSNLKKLQIIGNTLKDMEALEAKYFVRILVSNMRLGVNAPTFLAATANLFESPDARSKLDKAYYFTSDLGLILFVSIKDGLDQLEKYHHPHPGVPVKCMTAEREKDANAIFERLGNKVGVEIKYDGYRVQIHITNEKVTLFSRNQDNYTKQFPDLIEPAQDMFNGENTILEGEIVAYDFKSDEIQPFQKLTTRSRKYDINKVAKEAPVKVFLFDIIYKDGKDLTELNFPNRRKILEDCIKPNLRFELAELTYCSSVDELDNLLLNAKSKQIEGVMVKDIGENSIYQAGGRGFGWIKYKVDYMSQLSDTFDLVVVGAYYGKGRRTGVFGTLLMAAWNTKEEKYQTFCKVGTGLDDEQLEQISNFLNENIIPKPPKNLDYNEIPDVWIKPKLILEIEGAEITSSPVHTVQSSNNQTLSLRFPRFIRIRNDKPSAPEGCTTVNEINKMI